MAYRGGNTVRCGRGRGFRSKEVTHTACDGSSVSYRSRRLRLGRVVGVWFSWVDGAGASVGAVHESFSGGDGCRVWICIEFEHRDREGHAAVVAVAAVFGHDDGNGAHGFSG